MPGDILKVDVKYRINPQKIIRRCNDHPVFQLNDPNILLHPSYKGIWGNYHVFSVPFRDQIETLTWGMEKEYHGLVREIVIGLMGVTGYLTPNANL